MKKIIFILALTLLFPVMANAWILTCDPYPAPAAGNKYVFEVTVDSGVKVDSAASADYRLSYDLTGVVLTTNHTFKVKACVEGVTAQPWGRVCSAESPFVYTVPSAPAAVSTKNIGVVSSP